MFSVDYSKLTITGQTPTISAVANGNKNNFTVGLKENRFGNFISKLYPNPAADVINIEVPFNSKDISIFNQLGQSVYSGPFQNSISIAFLNSGIYFLQIKTENGIARKKFIKE